MGFEPTEARASAVFKTATINHSDTHPQIQPQNIIPVNWLNFYLDITGFLAGLPWPEGSVTNRLNNKKEFLQLSLGRLRTAQGIKVIGAGSSEASRFATFIRNPV